MQTHSRLGIGGWFGAIPKCLSLAYSVVTRTHDLRNHRDSGSPPATRICFPSWSRRLLLLLPLPLLSLGCGEVFSDLPAPTVQQVPLIFVPYSVYPPDSNKVTVLVDLADDNNYPIGDNSNEVAGLALQYQGEGDCESGELRDENGLFAHCFLVITDADAEAGEHEMKIDFFVYPDEIVGVGKLTISAPVGG